MLSVPARTAREVVCLRQLAPFASATSSFGALGELALEDLNGHLRRAQNSESIEGCEVILDGLETRAEGLRNLGLGHLQLGRASSSLSGGEGRRLRLATQLASDLSGLVYVFDEASAGAHLSERARLLREILRLRDRGNSVVLVEHDALMRSRADLLVEIGPGAGREGGRLISSATPSKEAARWPRSWCEASEGRARRRPRQGQAHLPSVGLRNLKCIDVDFMIGGLNVICGPSGAGKSTLLLEALAPALTRAIAGETSDFGAKPTRLLIVDQSDMGRSLRSNPATYSGVFDGIRALFAGCEEARERGLSKSDFSFNSKGGRCEHCEGRGGGAHRSGWTRRVDAALRALRRTPLPTRNPRSGVGRA